MNTISLDALVEKHGDYFLTTPDDLLEEAMDKLSLASILTNLPIRQVAIVLLKMEGYQTSKEISTILKCSVSTIDQDLFDIRAIISNLLRWKSLQ